MKKIKRGCSIVLIFVLILGNMNLSAFADTHQHVWVESIEKATFYADGYVKQVCDECGAEEIIETIYQLDSVKLSQYLYLDDGTEKYPDVIVTDVNGNVVDSKYYVVDYQTGTSMDDPDHCSAVVNFTGRYRGDSNCTYFVKTPDIRDDYVYFDDRVYLYTGKEVEPKVWIDGLEEGVHFNVSYENNVELGTGTIIITGIGEFYGTTTREFNIDYFTYLISNEEVIIADLSEEIEGDVIVPAYIEGYPVTELRFGAFNYCNKVTSFTLPDTLKIIGDGAFSGCDSLKTLIIPEGVTSIGEEAFSTCALLETVILPDSLTELGKSAFNGNTALTHITLGKNLKKIEPYTFIGCTGLTEVKFNENLQSIGAYAFRGCTGLTELSFPDSITIIGREAFKNCDGLLQIELPAKLQKLGSSAFRSCDALTSVSVPGTLKQIGISAFYDCANLQDVQIAEGVESIGSYAFFDCPNLTDVTLPSTVQTIGECAFGEDPSSEEPVPDEPELSENDIGNVKFTLGYDEHVFCRRELTPWVIADGLTEGEDFVVYYENNYHAGKAKVVITGVGEYTGTKILYFTITKRDINLEPYYEISEYSYVYDGTAKEPEVTLPELTEGVDFNIIYEDNVEAGEAAAIICGTGDYIGTYSVTFDIEPLNLYDIWQTAELSKTTYIYDGTAKKPKVTVPGLTEGKDFVVKYVDNIEPGYAQIHILGIGSCYNDIVLDYIIKLPTPTLSVTTDAETGKPELSWDMRTDNVVYQYEIYRSKWEDRGFVCIDETTPFDEEASPYLDTSATPGVKYYYKIRAIANASDEISSKYSLLRSKQAAKPGDSSFSKVKSITCDLARPTVKVYTVDSSGKPKLTWKNVYGASKYVVYRAFQKNGRYHKICTTSKTAYTHESAVTGKKYYYKVQAVHKTNSKANSALSVYKAVTCDCARPVVSIKLSSAGKPKLSWKAVAGASKYEIWRASSKNGKYTKIYTTKKQTFTNSKANKGKRYYYKVRAVCSKTKNGNSAYSLKKSITSR